MFKNLSKNILGFLFFYLIQLTAQIAKEPVKQEPAYKCFIGHDAPVWKVLFSNDGKKIISVSLDGKVRFWGPTTGGSIELFGLKDVIGTVALGVDGKNVVFGTDTNESLNVWDIENDLIAKNIKKLPGHTLSVSAVGCSRDASKIVSIASYDKIILWDATKSPEIPIKFLPCGSWGVVYCADFSSSSQKIAFGLGSKKVKIWDLQKDDVKTLSKISGPVWSVAFSPDDKKIAIGSSLDKLGIWDIETDKHIELVGHTGRIWALAFSPEGNMVASASSDRTIILWDVQTGKMLKQLTGHTAHVLCLAFSPDGEKLVSGSGDKTLILWDLTKL